MNGERPPHLFQEGLRTERRLCTREDFESLLLSLRGLSVDPEALRNIAVGFTEEELCTLRPVFGQVIDNMIALKASQKADLKLLKPNEIFKTDLPMITSLEQAVLLLRNHQNYEARKSILMRGDNIPFLGVVNSWFQEPLDRYIKYPNVNPFASYLTEDQVRIDLQRVFDKCWEFLNAEN